MTSITPEQLVEATKATIQAAKYCFLITISTSGHPNARLMQPHLLESDLTIWFGTSASSRKVREIRYDGRVTAAYHDPEETAYVTLLGSAEVVDDPDLQRTYWREDWLDFFPGGPETDDYLLIKFTPFRVEVLNFARDVVPRPYGLRPAVMVRAGETWVVLEGEDVTPK